VCGFNFRFGKKAAGNAELLVDYFNGRSTIGEASHVVPPVMLGDRVISSSCIRELISGGDLYTANKMLGRPFSITHTVVHGKHLGTELGFPTINHVFAEDEVVPAFGIYATKTAVNGESFISVTNVGIRPTVSDSDTVTCETHIIGLEDKNKDFYGKEAEISFYSRLRDEKRFDSPAMLSEAIAADVEAVKDYFYNDKNEK
jgi:riboflavin kinase/FMN adenylyltransferase